MTTRKGATLVEVLVAIFVMGIGLMALLVLFPLGALTMAEAIQNDRASHLAANANAIAKLKNIREDYDWTPNVNSDDAYTEKENATDPPMDPNGPSNPIYIDPIGYLLNTGSAITQVGSTRI